LIFVAFDPFAPPIRLMSSTAIAVALESPRMGEAPDEQLMLAYRGGDADAFEILYRRHRARLFRFVLRGIGQRGVAEELFQEIWMRVIEARGNYAPKARFTTWLYTIAHNRMVDHWRRSGLSLVTLEDADLPVTSADPARQAEGREALARFAAALESLPPAQREAFLLHEEAGLSVGEIAAATGSNEEAAKSRLRYALAKLKAAADG
jgi:RNA polymerase sigma-70 factor (ECF subfamily)